jgi:hypothetical protein
MDFSSLLGIINANYGKEEAHRFFPISFKRKEKE